MIQAIASLQVNGITLNWTETGKRALKTCRLCRKPTRGRLQEKEDERRGKAACLICAMTAALQAAEKKIRRTRKASRVQKGYQSAETVAVT